MEDFKVVFEDKELPVQVRHTGGTTLYAVKFTDRQPLFLCRALNAQKEYFWTSVPQGRLKEATEIGVRIDLYLKKKESHVLL
jgi:hypothetical protein